MNLFKFLFKRNSKKSVVYRVDILKYALKHRCETFGLCYNIKEAINHLCGKYIIYEQLVDIIPEFNRKNAVRLFNAKSNTIWWWDHHKWKDRKAFLKWLIEYYKDDKTDVNEIIRNGKWY